LPAVAWMRLEEGHYDPRQLPGAQPC
jgi:hypothetical protein